jgi:hypothetical protein
VTSIDSHQPWPRRWRAIALAGAAAVLALVAQATARQAVTSDEAYHVLAGYQADRYGENGLNLEHPPLLKMVAALPLLAATPPLAPMTKVTTALTTMQAVFTRPDAEAAVRLGSRALVAGVFGLPLLLVAFCLGREVGGAAAGAVLALMLGLDFSVFPLLCMVYTDTAAALGCGLALLAAARFLRRPTLPPAALAGLGLGLAIASKFTGLLALPAVAGALLLAPRRQPAGPGISPGRRLLCGAVAVGMAWACVELAYAAANRHYRPAAGRETTRLYAEDLSTMRVDDRMRPFEGFLLAVERRDPRAAQWLTGLLATQAQNAIGTYPACNFGRMSSRGRWWYFPVLLVAKTPLAVLLASAAALAAAFQAARRRRGMARQGRPAISASAPEVQLLGVLGGATIAATSAGTPAARPAATPAARPAATPAAMPAPIVRPPSATTRVSAAMPAAATAAEETARRRFALLLGSTAAIYLAVAMTSNYNAGLRHLLPVLPVLYLPAALWATRRPRIAAVILGALLIESVALAPIWVSSTSTWWLGARDPLRFALSTDNCFYPQNLAALRAAAERRSLRPLHLLDPSLGTPQVERYLGPGVGVMPEDPLPAGWYAIGTAAEVCLPAIVRSSPREMYGYARYRAIADRWLPATTAVARAGDDFGYVAGTFHLYRLASPLPPPGQGARP